MLKQHRAGTHRLVSPEETLRRIEPHLDELGITRCADITALDHLGIPVYCAIRPRGVSLQVSNGKGLRHVDAQVSALMESLELHHAENPVVPFRRTSQEILQREGSIVVTPAALPGSRPDRYWSPRFVVDWIECRDLQRETHAWIPAGAVYLTSSSLCDFTTNGLASGNHTMEAALHALYEVIERDAVSRLSVNGRLQITQRCRVVDLGTVSDGPIRWLNETVTAARLKLVLLRVSSPVPIPVFTAMLLDGNSFSSSSMASVGHGAHLSPEVAATRAITEAAQVRLTRIHGAREDLPELGYTGEASHQRVFSYFDRLTPEMPWSAMEDFSADNLEQDYQFVLRALAAEGFATVWCAELTRAPLNVPVVKTIVPGMEMKASLF